MQINKECISGTIAEGITSIILTYKEDQCRIHFGSLDKSGMHSYTWYASDLRPGDCLSVLFTDITQTSEVKEMRDYNKPSEELQKENLELYARLKKELTEEGLL